MTIAITIIGTVVAILLFIILVALGGLYIHQQNFEKELKETLEKKQASPEVTVNFPFESVFELQDKIDHLQYTATVNCRMIGIVANACAINISRIMQKDEEGLSPESMELLKTTHAGMMNAIKYFYGTADVTNFGNTKDNKNEE